MFRNMGLAKRMMILIGAGVFIVLAVLVAYVNSRVQDTTRQNATEYADELTDRIESDTAGKMRQLFAALEGFTNTAEAMLNSGGKIDREQLKEIQSHYMRKNPGLFNIYCMFQPDGFDGRDREFVNQGLWGESGRYAVTVERDLNDPNKINVKAPSPGYDNKDYYRKCIDSKKPEVLEPYTFDIVKNGVKTSVLETTFCIPIMGPGGAVGMAGADIILENLSRDLAEIKPMGSGYAFLVSAEGMVMAHPDLTLIGKTLADIGSGDLMPAVKNAQKANQWRVAAGTKGVKERAYVTLTPVRFEKAKTAWALGAVFPDKVVYAEALSLRNNTIILGVVALLLLILLVYYIAKSVIGPLDGLTGELDQISNEVSHASERIGDANRELAEGSANQASHLGQTSTALEQMASMTRQNSENASRTNEITRDTASRVEKCADCMNRMSVAMGDINDKTAKVSQIVKTIEEIAFQTNLLALNAAVEAARAGEAGKGFAVVADEVRNLSQRSAQAARDTTELIQGTVESVRNGSAIAGELETVFKGIEEGSLKVDKVIGEIAAASNEQAHGVDQVNTAMAQIDKATQRNTALAGQSSEAAQELGSHSGALDHIVSRLVGLVSGNHRMESSRPAPVASRALTHRR